MDKQTSIKIIQLYNQGNSLREIEKIIEKYGREQIRKELKKASVIMRGRVEQYTSFSKLSNEKQILLSELLGYMYGDGHVHKNKNTSHGLYDSRLHFALNEADLVENASDICKNVFFSLPKIRKTEHLYQITFKRSIARYLANLGYPVGKKSRINPVVIKEMYSNREITRAFIQGFMNAEAGIGKTITIQQSVKTAVPDKVLKQIEKSGKPAVFHNKIVYFTRWKDAENHLNKNMIKESSVLKDIRKMLKFFDIESFMSPVRTFSNTRELSIHHELRISKFDLIKVKQHNLLTCKKKLDKLEKLLQG